MAPSTVSRRAIPAVKRMGKIMISQIEVPFVASILAIPRRAISEEVSNPNPTGINQHYFINQSPSCGSTYKELQGGTSSNYDPRS